MRIVLVTGTVGVGKSTVGFAVAERAARAEAPTAFVDVDQLSRSWPAPDDDPFGENLARANLAAVAPNYRAAGVALLVLAWVVEGEADITRLEGSLGMPVTVVRLTSPAAVVEARLRSRHRGPDAEGLAWHLRRAPELAATQAALDAPTVDAEGPVAAVADRVLQVIGEVPSSPAPTGDTPT